MKKLQYINDVNEYVGLLKQTDSTQLIEIQYDNNQYTVEYQQNTYHIDNEQSLMPKLKHIPIILIHYTNHDFPTYLFEQLISSFHAIYILDFETKLTTPQDLVTLYRNDTIDALSIKDVHNIDQRITSSMYMTIQ